MKRANEAKTLTKRAGFIVHSAPLLIAKSAGDPLFESGEDRSYDKTST
jgi:hypothetical protein